MSIDEFRVWCVGQDEPALLCAKAKLLKEINAGEKMLHAVNARLDYLEKFSVENITKLAKSLEIEPPQASD
jgi:hypothetical protein